MSETLRPEPLVSIVIPVLNEQQVLPLLLPRLQAVMDALPGGGEAWFVDDGSSDGSGRLIEAAHERDPRIKLVQLSRNFGHAAAITAGLDCATGDAVVLMDADLQDPPELIPQMVALYRRGTDVVQAHRKARLSESAFKRATAWLFYRLMRMVGDTGIDAGVGEFRLMSRPVVEALRRLHERHRLVRGLVSWVGFSQASLDFDRPGRAAGATKYSLGRMTRLGLDAITSFSVAPLRIATMLGFCALLAGIGYAIYAVYIGFVLGLGVPGWTSLVILNIFFSGVILLCLGMVGEYVARIFEEVKRRPLYVVKRTLGLEPAGPPRQRDGGV